MTASSTTRSASSASTAQPPATETSPLLAKSVATSFAADDEIIERGSVDSYEGYGTDEGDKGREVEVYKPGKSSFGQTLLNILGDLIGTGLLACPIAIAHAGWIFGPITLILIGGFTLWTLKILLRIIEQDRRMRNFTDIIGYALGPVGERWVTTIFLLEICAWIVALVVLFSDSMEAVFPQYSSNQWKFLGMIIVVPTSFLPLRYLSFSSGIGITATWTLVVILISSGITTEHAPGSLRDPAPTDLFPSHGWIKFGTVLGLLISGFGGHGLIPNLVHDMKHPKQADRACEVAYLISMIVYLLVAICGYIMYGTSVSDEVSKDLARTPGFSPVVNKIAVLMVAINPLTKVPLGLRPLADMFFTKFNLHPTTLIPESAPTPRYVTRPPSLASETSTAPPSPITRSDVIPVEVEIAHYRNERNKAILRPVVRVAMAILAILGGVLMPSFESVLSFLGGGLGVVSTVIIPVWAGANVFGWTKWSKGVVAVSAVLAVVGTVFTPLLLARSLTVSFFNPFRRAQAENASGQITVQVKWGRDRFNIPIPKPSITPLSTLLQTLSHHTSLPLNQLKLVYKGAVLKDPSLTISSYGIAEGSTLVLIGKEGDVPSAPAPKPTSATPGPIRGKAKQPQTDSEPVLTEWIANLVKSTLEPLQASIATFISYTSPKATNRPKQIPAFDVLQKEHARLSEILLRGLLDLDSVEVQSGWTEARKERKEGVKRVQAELTKVDEAWGERKKLGG